MVRYPVHCQYGRRDYLFFVARPDGSHYFGKTYAEHEANIRKADEEAERLAAENED